MQQVAPLGKDAVLHDDGRLRGQVKRAGRDGPAGTAEHVAEMESHVVFEGVPRIYGGRGSSCDIACHDTVAAAQRRRLRGGSRHCWFCCGCRSAILRRLLQLDAQLPGVS